MRAIAERAPIKAAGADLGARHRAIVALLNERFFDHFALVLPGLRPVVAHVHVLARLDARFAASSILQARCAGLARVSVARVPGAELVHNLASPSFLLLFRRLGRLLSRRAVVNCSLQWRPCNSEA